MRPYLAVPTYLMELWWIFSPCLGWLKDGTFHLCLSYLVSSLKSMGENMILWFLNNRHSGTLFDMWFLTSAQQLFLLILSSIGWIYGPHGYGERVQLKSSILRSERMVQKELQKLSQWFGKGFQNGMMEGRKWNHIKRVFEVEVFSSFQNIDFLIYLKRFLELFSLFF
jgi:hypothetical protein